MIQSFLCGKGSQLRKAAPRPFTWQHAGNRKNKAAGMVPAALGCVNA